MDTGAVILTSFLSTIPVYLFFATGFYLRHKQVIQQRFLFPPGHCSRGAGTSAGYRGRMAGR